MGFFSGMTTGIYRYTTDGRRVYRLGFVFGLVTRWYLISDDEAPRFERRLRLYLGLTLFAIIPVVVLVAGSAWWIWVGVGLLWPSIGLHLWVLRGVPRISLLSQDLQPDDRRAREISQLQSMGEPVLWLLLLAGIAMTANAVFVLTLGFDWLTLLGVAMFSVGSGYMVRGIIRLRRARGATSTGST